MSQRLEGKDAMAKILIIHGAGMNMRGKVQTEIFGPMTLPEYDERIRGYAASSASRSRFFIRTSKARSSTSSTRPTTRVSTQRRSTRPVIERLPALVGDLSGAFPTIEIHISNPVRRGSGIGDRARRHGMVTGFAPGYYLALRGIRDMLAAK
jgi:3-dehydroquinate dehydratase-2